MVADRAVIRTNAPTANAGAAAAGIPVRIRNASPVAHKPSGHIIGTT
jgi:hypothetical protein